VDPALGDAEESLELVDGGEAQLDPRRAQAERMEWREIDASA